jgi:RNA polymerase sigma-70 factor (ECF subfamily)
MHAAHPSADEAVAVDPTTDAVLAARAALGDRGAFAQIFRRHGPGMFRYALRMLDGDHDAAEDAVQDALADVWVHLPGFRAESALHTWLFRITANQVLAARRRRRPLAVDDGLLNALAGPDHRSPAALVQQAHMREALDLALSELPWRQRASWLLRELEGLSYDEIADILQTSPTVVRGQLHRARRTLAIRMSQWR